MLFRTVVLLTSRVNLLIKGVAPGRVACDRYRGVICLGCAGRDGVKTMKTAPMMISEHAFIKCLVLDVSPNRVPTVSKKAVQVQQKFR